MNDKDKQEILVEDLRLKKEHYDFHVKHDPEAWFLKQDLANIKRSEKSVKALLDN